MDFNLSSFKHSVNVQVRFNDIDGFRHINNSIMYEYFDLGRMSYLKNILNFNYKQLKEENLVIVSTKTDFIKPVHIDDNLKVLTKVFHIGNKSIKMMQWLVKVSDDNPSVTCMSVLAGFNPLQEISMVIPDKWKKLLIDFEKELLLT